MSPLAFTSGDPRWCSYRQAAARGWQVRKGEKATPVYFYKSIEIEGKGEDGGHETRRIPILRTFSVFHASQIDGIPALGPSPVARSLPERIEDAEIVVRASGVPVRIGGDRAFYSPALDFIQMPPDVAFESPEARAATLLHELAHASGHPSRLNRDLDAFLPRRPRAITHAGIRHFRALAARCCSFMHRKNQITARQKRPRLAPQP